MSLVALTQLAAGGVAHTTPSHASRQAPLSHPNSQTRSVGVETHWPVAASQLEDSIRSVAASKQAGAAADEQTTP
jgi:hypothetical protein